MATINETANVSVFLTTDEANRKLKELKLSAGELKEKLDQMGKGSPERKEAQMQLRQLNKEIKSVQQALNKRVDLVINGNLAGASIRDLKEASRQLYREISKLAPETQEFINKSKNLQQVENRLRSLNETAKGTSGFWYKMKNELKAFGVMALGFLGFQALASQIQNVISKNAQMSDSMADVQKTTGLTKMEVESLNGELGKMNTRTGRQELLKLAADAGKLGITGKENILGFVRAADKINVALGEDLGEDGIKNIGKLNDLFKVRETDGYEGGMMKIGSAINALGQASTANEGYLVDFAKRTGGISTQAKITIQDILGLGATLDSLGQTSETSSTVIGTLLTDMFKDTGTYAKLAKMDVADFTTLLNTDANEAFIKVLEGLKGNNDGYSVMAQRLKEAGVEGARGTAVLSTLAGNTKLLREQQSLSNVEFEKGTSIMNEFNTKNETFGAKWDKLIKRIYGSLSNSTMTLYLEGMTDWILKVTDATPAMEQLTQEYNKQKEAVAGYEKNIVPLINRYDELKGKSMLTKDEQIELKKIIDQISKAIPTAITEFDKYGNALDINSEKAKLFGDNLRNMMEVKNADALKESRASLYDLREEIEKTQKALSTRDINGDLVQTVRVTKKVAGEFESYTKEVKLTATQIEKLQEKLKALNNTQTGIELNINELSGTELYKPQDQTQTVTQQVVTEGNTNTTAGPDPKALEDFIKKTKELTKQLEDINIAAIEDEEQRELAKLAKKLERQKKEVTESEADAKIKNNLLLALDEDYLKESKSLTEKYALEKNNEAYSRDVSNLNAWNQTQQLLLLEQLNRGEITDLQYKEKLKQQESDFLQERKKLAIAYGGDVVEIEKQIQENIRSEQKNTVEEDKINRRAQLEFNLQYARKGSEEEMQARIAILTEQLAQELANTNFTTEQKEQIWQAYYDTVSQMNRDHLANQLQEAQTYIDAFMTIFNNLSSLMNAKADKELAGDKRANDQKKQNLKRQLDSKKITEEKYRTEIEKLDAEYEVKASKHKREAFKREKTAKTIQAVINTALGVTAAFTLPPPASFIMAALTAAAGAIEIAAIVSAPEPEFEKGRKPTTGIVKGPSHAQEGIKLVDSKTGKVVGEMEGDEGIFSKKMYSNNSEIIDAIFNAEGEPIQPGLNSGTGNIEINIPDKKQINPNRVITGDGQTIIPGTEELNIPEKKQINPNREITANDQTNNPGTERLNIPDKKQVNPKREIKGNDQTNNSGTERLNIPDKKQVNPKKEIVTNDDQNELSIFEAGKVISSELTVEQVSTLKDKTLQLFESTNKSEQNEALKNFREYSEEVVRIYKEKTEVVNAIENNQQKVTSDVSIKNISKNQTLESSINAIDKVVTTISDRKVLAFQQSEYFKKAAYLISQAEDGMLTKETLEVNMKFLEKRLIDRTVDQAPLPGSANRDTTGTILNPELDLRTVAARMVMQEDPSNGISGPKLNLPNEPVWQNQAVPQLNADRIIENIRMEESIKTMYIMEQLKKEFLVSENKSESKSDQPPIPRTDEGLIPVITQLSEVLNDMKTKGVRGVWDHRSFSEGLEDMEEIHAKARF